MAREREDYRANLEILQTKYPGRCSLTIQEACAVMERDRRTLLKDRAFPARMIGNKYVISISALARYMS